MAAAFAAEPAWSGWRERGLAGKAETPAPNPSDGWPEGVDFEPPSPPEGKVAEMEEEEDEEEDEEEALHPRPSSLRTVAREEEEEELLGPEATGPGRAP